MLASPVLSYIAPWLKATGRW